MLLNAAHNKASKSAGLFPICQIKLTSGVSSQFVRLHRCHTVLPQAVAIGHSAQLRADSSSLLATTNSVQCTTTWGGIVCKTRAEIIAVSLVK